MPGEAPPTGFRSYLVQLGRTVVFPLMWMQAMRFARDQEDVDPRAPTKLTAAIVVSVVLTAGVGALLYAGAPGVPSYIIPGYSDLRSGMYDSLDSRLAEAVEESGVEGYQGQVDRIEASLNTMRILARNLQELVEDEGDPGQAADADRLHGEHEESLEALQPEEGEGLVERLRDAEDVEDLAAQVREGVDRMQSAASALNDTASQLNDTASVFASAHQNETDTVHEALDELVALADNHRLYLELKAVVAQEQAKRPLVQETRNERIQETVAASGLDVTEGVEGAIGRYDDAKADMDRVFLILLIPGLVGVFYAPLVLAMGSVLRTRFEPSATVGYKPYPGRAMGLFLLLGGFGIPALFFAAWAFQDMEIRRLEGQIAL